jgi:hypothetical protein
LWLQHKHTQNASSVAADAKTFDHFLFVTVEQDSYNELEASFPGTVILEKAFAWPTSAVKWHSFRRLLGNRLTVGIMSARDVAGMSGSSLWPLLWQHTLSAECDAVLYHHPNNRSEDKTDRERWDIFSIRPSPTSMLFWDEYQKHGQGNGLDQTGPLFAPRHQEKADDENVCFCGL